MLQERKKIAVFVSGIYKEYQRNIIKGMIEEAKKLNFELFIFSSFANEDADEKRDKGEYNIFSLPKIDKYDGVISLINTIQSKNTQMLYEKCKESGVPLVDIDNITNGSYFVGIDNASAMRTIVEHFINEHGFKRINFITGPMTNPEAKIRFDTYRKVLEENGIEYDERRVYFGQFYRKNGAEAVKQFVEADIEMPQAIISSNDVMAFSAFEELTKRGIKVPEDVALSGFDNTDEAFYHTPQITTIDRPLLEIGKCACMKLFYHFNDVSQPIEQYMDCNPVFTQSCGCPKIERDSDDINNPMFYQIESLSDYIVYSDNMQDDLCGSNSVLECVQKLKKYLPPLQCDKFALYLCEDWDGTNTKLHLDDYDEAYTTSDYLSEGYTEYVHSVLDYQNQKFVEPKTIKSSQIHTEADEMTGTVDFHIISPIHFLDRCFGYTVITNSYYPMESVMYHSWLSNLSNALENIRKQDELAEIVAHLDKLYIRDVVTGLYNRRGFMRDVMPLYNKCAEEGKYISILYFDLDGLKTTNDQFGHDEGDALIASLAKIIILESLEGSVAARFGGDEYVLFIPNADDKQAAEIQKRIEGRIENHNNTSNKPYKLSCSIGAHSVKANTEISINDCISVADAQMYKVKYQKKKKSK